MRRNLAALRRSASWSAIGLTVSNRYDQYLRRTNLLAGSGVPFSAFYGVTNLYDGASRLGQVADGVTSASYSYLANSPWVGQMFYTNNGTRRMTRTHQYDFLNRLTAVASAAASVSNAFAYAYNSANQRFRCTLADSSYWVYQYDTLAQGISGKKSRT